MDLVAGYRAIYERVVTLASDLSDDDVATTVVPTPAWSVKDTVAHMVGAIADVMDGNLDGFGGDEWTARQVEARRDHDLEAVCSEWTAILPRFETFLADTGRQYIRLVSGSWTHEQDIRGSLGLRGVGDTGGMAATLEGVPDVGPRLDDAGVSGVRFVTPERSWDVGRPAATLTTSAYVLARLMYGRRSPAQIRAMDWEGDPEPYIPLLGPYGPASVDIHD